MKKILYICLSSLLAAAPAFAEATFVTSPEDGERVRYDGSKMHVYDAVVFESVPEGETYREVPVDEKQRPAQVLPRVVRSLTREMERGTLLAADFVDLVGLVGEKQAKAMEGLSLPEKLDIILEAMGRMETAPAAGPDACFMGEDGKTPYISISIQLTYASEDAFQDTPGPQRKYAENYTFARLDAEGAGPPVWGLYSVVRYSPDFFGPN